VALLQPGGVIPRDQRRAVRLLREKYLQREIECSAGRREHDGRAGLWVAEDEQLGCGQVEADCTCLRGVVDEREELYVLLGQQGGEALDEFVDGVV